MIRATAILALLASSTLQADGTPVDRRLDRADWVDRLQAMWLAENIANHTGLTTEGTYREPPFLTDAAWATHAGSNGQLIDFVFLDPWPADDDTDIEYVYVHLMSQHGVELTAAQIWNGWRTHINRYIWVSNERARELMERGVLPPITGSTCANRFSPRIDAQLTTEMFGAVAPGMTGVALELADLPIRTTSADYATHAAQFFVALYAAAATSDRTQPLNEQIMSLVLHARSVIPDTSKSADICDYVLADFLDNPDPDDWERTRDRVHQRYQLLLPDTYHGFPSPQSLDFRYRAWTESSVNFATALIALLYGEGDLARTIQIGTLSGWDSDNGTATIGGLLGLLLGYDAVVSSFPDAPPLSDRYDIARTRDNLPPHVADPEAQDTFALIAARMADLAAETISSHGGLVDEASGTWLLPPAAAWSPTTRLQARSVNLGVRAAGGTVTAAASVSASPDPLYGRGDPSLFATGAEHDFVGLEPDFGNVERKAYASQNAGLATGDPLTLSVEWSLPVTVSEVRLTEDDHFESTAETISGGWFESVSLEVRVGTTWMTPQAAGSGVVDFPVLLHAAIPYQRLVWIFEHAITIDGIRVTGAVGGAGAFVTVADLDALSPEDATPPPTWDLTADGVIDVRDLYAWHEAPVDMDDDGDIDAHDGAAIRNAVRWLEKVTLTSRP